MKLLSVLLIAILFMQVFVVAEVSSATDTAYPLSQGDEGCNFEGRCKKHHPHKINCKQACARRCSKSSRKKICHRACKGCCGRCHCVPPGTYGNKELCPCYDNLRTHGNKPKCP